MTRKCLNPGPLPSNISEGYTRLLSFIPDNDYALYFEDLWQKKRFHAISMTRQHHLS